MQSVATQDTTSWEGSASNIEFSCCSFEFLFLLLMLLLRIELSAFMLTRQSTTELYLQSFILFSFLYFDRELLSHWGWTQIWIFLPHFPMQQALQACTTTLRIKFMIFLNMGSDIFNMQLAPQVKQLLLIDWRCTWNMVFCMYVCICVHVNALVIVCSFVLVQQNKHDSEHNGKLT